MSLELIVIALGWHFLNATNGTTLIARHCPQECDKQKGGEKNNKKINPEPSSRWGKGGLIYSSEWTWAVNQNHFKNWAEEELWTTWKTCLKIMQWVQKNGDGR